MALETHSVFGNTSVTAGSTSTDLMASGTDPWSDETWGKTVVAASSGSLGLGTTLSSSQDAASAAMFPFSADPPEGIFPSISSSGTDFLFDDNFFRPATTTTTTASLLSSSSSPTKSTTSSWHNNNNKKQTSEYSAMEMTTATTTTSSGPALVRVAIHEQVSALYDGVTDEPVCHVEGSIYVQPSPDLEATPFLLVIRDLESHVASWKDWPSTCQNVSDQVSRKGLHRTDRVLRITTKPESQRLHSNKSSSPQDNLIAQYICTDRVRPVPLLIKSRVVCNHRYCRVGFKVRANPSNSLPLTRVVLLLAVPPHIEGRTAKMSRKGGIWDEMKRTISWMVPKLEPGQALEIQAQFEGPGTDGTQENEHATPRFPILARGDYAQSYSALEVKKSEHARDGGISHPISSLKMNRSGRVLHRKV